LRARHPLPQQNQQTRGDDAAAERGEAEVEKHRRARGNARRRRSQPMKMAM
jgi:hypothetical protein